MTWDAQIICDKDTGVSKGYGFITFATPQMAEEAKRVKDGTLLKRKTVNVREATGSGYSPSSSGKPPINRPVQNRDKWKLPQSRGPGRRFPPDNMGPLSRYQSRAVERGVAIDGFQGAVEEEGHPSHQGGARNRMAPVEGKGSLRGVRGKWARRASVQPPQLYVDQYGYPFYAEEDPTLWQPRTVSQLGCWFLSGGMTCRENFLNLVFFPFDAQDEDWEAYATRRGWPPVYYECEDEHGPYLVPVDPRYVPMTELPEEHPYYQYCRGFRSGHGKMAPGRSGPGLHAERWAPYDHPNHQL